MVKTVGDAVWHRKLLILAILAVVLLAGAALYDLTPPTYEAQAQVYVDPGADQALQQGEGLLIRDIAQQATSRRVLQRASLQLAGSPTPELLAPRITAAVVQAPNLVAISATAGSPAGAAELANAVAVAVVGQHRADSAQRGLQSQTYLTGELARLGTVMKTDKAAGAPAEQQNLDQQQYTNTYARLQDLQLRLTRAAESVSVGQQALAPDRPVNPDLARYLGVAAAGGIFIALLVALLVERFDDRVFDSEAVANASGAPLVVVTPSARRAHPDELPAQYTLAYAHIAARYPSARTIMVAASSHRESTDPVAAAFGDAAELAGDQAIVLQREPSAKPRPINIPKQGRRWPIVSRSTRELSVMTEGAAGPSTMTLPALAIASPERAPSAGLGSAAPRTFVAVPAPFLNPKAASLSHVVDVAIVVAVARATRIAEVVRTAESLRHVGVELVAVILVPKKSTSHNRGEPNGRKASVTAHSITLRPGEAGDGFEDRHRRSATLAMATTGVAPTREIAPELLPTKATAKEAFGTEAITTEAITSEAIASEAIPTKAMSSEAITTKEIPVTAVPAEAAPSEASSGETVPARGTPTPAEPIAVTKKSGDDPGVAEGATARGGAATRPARADKILVATPSAVKSKADHLARTRTKAYRIKTKTGS